MSGEDIKRKRKELGLSQTDLAEKLGVSMTTIYNWERGGVIPGTAIKRLKEVLYGKSETNDKTTKAGSLNIQIHQATWKLIDALNDEIEEVRKEASSIESFEKIKQILKLELELMDQLIDLME